MSLVLIFVQVSAFLRSNCHACGALTPCWERDLCRRFTVSTTTRRRKQPASDSRKIAAAGWYCDKKRNPRTCVRCSVLVTPLSWDNAHTVTTNFYLLWMLLSEQTCHVTRETFTLETRFPTCCLVNTVRRSTLYPKPLIGRQFSSEITTC